MSGKAAKRGEPALYWEEKKMLSIDQLTILSYMTDGGIVCRSCGEKANLPTKDALCAYSTHEFSGNEGLTCDDCGKEIVEAYEWTCPHCDNSYYGDEASDAETVYYQEEKCSEDCPGETD